MATTIHRSDPASQSPAGRGEPIRLSGKVIGYTGDPGGIGARVRQQGTPPPLDQLRASNQKRQSSSSSTPGATPGVKRAAGAQQGDVRARLAAATARIRAQQTRQQGGGGGSPAGPGGGKDQQQGQQNTRFAQRGISHISHFLSGVAERIGSAPTAGSVGLELLILFFFIFVVVKVSANGTLTRAQLIFYTLLGQASLPPARTGGPGNIPSIVVAQMTAPQPGGARAGLSPSEQQSNIRLAQQNAVPVSASPRPTRLPPMPPSLSS